MYANLEQPISMYQLSNKHSFSLPAVAKYVDVVRKPEDLDNVSWRDDSFILGGGTNTLFTENFEGHLILNELRGTSVESRQDHFVVRLAAGENWHEAVASLLEQGIDGLENLALIPGSVGAAPVQNIGAYGVEVGEFVAHVRGVDLRSKQPFCFTKEECQFGYRDSIFKQPGHASLCITEVELHLSKQWQPRLSYPDLAVLPPQSSALDIFEHVIKVRQHKLPDPEVLPNSGSFFKNPVVSQACCKSLRHKYPDMRFFQLNDDYCKLAAAWLIDEAGLKNLRIGGAGVHQRQALVLVNLQDATGADVIQLAQQVQKQVKARFGVDLEPEVRILGARGLVSL